MRQIYRYRFTCDLSMEDIEATLLLAIFSIEALYGEAQVHLEIRHFLDISRRACVIDASSAAGDALNRLFTGLLLREIGASGFSVEAALSSPDQSVNAIAA